MKARGKVSTDAFFSFLVIGLFGQQSALAATWDENWDATFGVPGALPYGVAAMTSLGENLYWGGSFTSVGGADISRIAKWDRIDWTSVGGGVSGDSATHVRALLTVCSRQRS